MMRVDMHKYIMIWRMNLCGNEPPMFLFSFFSSSLKIDLYLFELSVFGPAYVMLCDVMWNDQGSIVYCRISLSLSIETNEPISAGT
jgi:hypothetical protein